MTVLAMKVPLHPQDSATATKEVFNLTPLEHEARIARYFLELVTLIATINCRITEIKAFKNTLQGNPAPEPLVREACILVVRGQVIVSAVEHAEEAYKRYEREFKSRLLIEAHLWLRLALLTDHRMCSPDPNRVEFLFSNPSLSPEEALQDLEEATLGPSSVEVSSGFSKLASAMPSKGKPAGNN